MSRGAAIVWFRQDLRLRDNPALHAAATSAAAVIPLYIWSPEDEGKWPPGAASRWWLHHSLCALDGQLRQRGSRLILASGPTSSVLRKLVAETGATAVYWNRRYEPAALECTLCVRQMLEHLGVSSVELNGSLLAEPKEILNGSGEPYRVFTAFQRRLLHDSQPGNLLPLPRTLRSPSSWPASQPLQELRLLPQVPWDAGLQANWRPGEGAAQKALRGFVSRMLTEYGRARDFPAARATSRLSPHLHFGEIGPRQIWHAIRGAAGHPAFLREIIWREFAYHLLYHFPQTPDRPLRQEFEEFPWRRNDRLLRAWQQGRTGVPLVDAGMRELWSTGWMHNRVRMVAASFLVKNLLISWRQGACWFWDTLVDADLANNTLNWQWVAGCGADAAPYFRIFNPDLQSRRFDPENTYLARWVAEGEEHAPIVSLRTSREAALDAYAAMQRAAKGR